MMPSTPHEKKPRLSLIAAMAKNRTIGRGNAMPWHLPADLKRFKALTLGHPVIMGRKTFDSIVALLGKPLPGRENIVISRSAGAQTSTRWPDAKVRYVGSLDDAVREITADEAFVIGGAEIYALALPRADRLHLTEVGIEVEGDAFFPSFAATDWQETSRESGGSDRDMPFDFVTYERR
jgi:dihydrofolate reductase